MHAYKVIEQGKPLEQASKALILLHGRGGSAADILTFAKKFIVDDFYIAAPEATNQSWYPYSFLEEKQFNEPWLSSAIEVVKKLLDTTVKQIPQERIFLMGFSQGACLALEVAARFAAKYAGVIALSGGLIGNYIDETKYHGHFAGTPIFIGVSDHDPHIPLDRVNQSKEILEKLGAQVTLKVYPGESHLIREEEIQQVKKLYQI